MARWFTFEYVPSEGLCVRNSPQCMMLNGGNLMGSNCGQHCQKRPMSSSGNPWLDLVRAVMRQTSMIPELPSGFLSGDGMSPYPTYPCLLWYHLPLDPHQGCVDAGTTSLNCELHEPLFCREHPAFCYSNRKWNNENSSAQVVVGVCDLDFIQPDF